MDPVDLQIQWSRLSSIMDEVDAALVRTSFSTIVGETRDFAVVLLDGEARSIAQSQLSSPAFTCSLPIATRSMLQEFPPETLEPGDALITNDPWLCHGHLPDFYIVVPLFADTGVTAFIATAAHITDIGGRLDEFDSRDVHEEGFRIPPSKLYSGGKRNRLLFRLLEANIRTPRMVIGDVEAIIGAARVGARRFEEFIRDYTAQVFPLTAQDILTRSETAMRQAIRAIPNGRYTHRVFADGYREDTVLHATIEVENETLEIDYTGSSPERPDAAVNCVFNTTFAHTIYPLKCSLLPDLPNNEGLFRPISVKAPPGSIVNCSYPAAVKARTKTSYHLHNAIYGALAPVLPRSVQAGSGSFWSIKFFGGESDSFAAHVLPNGGKGAAAAHDGLPTIAFPGNGTITPAEILENHVPIVIRERSLRQDSGGPGKARGGLGQTIRVACRGREAVRIAVRPDKVRYPAPGIAGGMAGARGKAAVGDEPMPLIPFSLSADRELQLRLPGGGGFGPPGERDPAALSRDVALGYVSPMAAREHYGQEPAE